MLDYVGGLVGTVVETGVVLCAELGFFGVWVNTRVHTPRRCGAPLRAGVLALVGLDCRPLRTSCWMVGTQTSRTMNGTSGPQWRRGPAGRATPGCNSTGPPPETANGV